jgi:iron complex outermembrane receptor protein
VARAPHHALAADAAAPTSQPTAQVEEIVVTAQKREQALQDVPISITAMTGSTLEKAGVTDVKGLARLAPSFKAQENFQPVSQSYRIRGIGSEPSIPTFEPEVGLFVDGVYMPRSGLGVADLVDIARVEVLSGPQSTLYGKNVNAGVINVVTKAPSHEFEASASAQLADIDGGRNALSGRFAGSVSGPIGDRARIRLSGVNNNQGPTDKNQIARVGDTNDMNRYAVRGDLELDLGEASTLRLSAARSEYYDTNATNPDLFISTTDPDKIHTLQTNPGLHALFGVSPCPDNDPSDRVICTTDPMHAKGWTDLASAVFTSHLGELTFTSITAWTSYRSQASSADIAQAMLPLVDYTDTQTGHSFSQEFRLTSPTGQRFEWLAGATYMNTVFNRGDHGRTPTFVMGAAAPFIPLSPALPAIIKLGQPGDQGFLDSSSSSNYAAVFGQGTFHATDRLAVTVGLRYQHEAKDASLDNSFAISPLNPLGVNLITAVLTPTSVNGDVSIPDMDKLVGNVTAEFHPSQDAMIYATYSRGSKAGGANIGFGNAPLALRPFGEETVDKYEAGAKVDLADKRVRLATAVFHTVYHDYQNAGFIGAQFNVNNAEKVVVDGVEASGALALSPELSLNAALTYLDARYDTYTGGSCHWPTFLPACDLSGMPLPVAPKWSTALGVNWEHPTGFGAVYARGDWAWSSRYFTNTNLDPRNVQGSYSITSLRLGVKNDGGGWDASVYANNLFNKTYVVQDAVSTLFGMEPAFQRFLGAPREIGVTLRKDF